MNRNVSSTTPAESTILICQYLAAATASIPSTNTRRSSARQRQWVAAKERRPLMINSWSRGPLCSLGAKAIWPSHDMPFSLGQIEENRWANTGAPESAALSRTTANKSSDGRPRLPAPAGPATPKSHPPLFQTSFLFILLMVINN